MTRLIGAELFKLRKRLMTKVLLLVLVGLLIVLYLLLLAVSKANIPTPHDQQDTTNLLGLETAIPFALSILSSLGSVLAVILVASSVGNEYSWRTIRTFLVCSESRAKFLASKLIAVVTLIFIGMIVGVAAGFIMSLITTAIGGYSFDFGFMTGGYLWDQFLQFWRTFYVMMPYVLLGFMFAVVGRSSMPGIGLGIGILFLESLVTMFMTLAGGWVSEVPKFLLSANVRAITELGDMPASMRAGQGGDPLTDLPGVWQATGVLALYMVLFLGVAFYLFRKRDVTG